MSGPVRYGVLILVASVMVLQGCAASQPSRFYVLSSLPNTETKTRSAEAKPGPVIGVGPVDLAQYLDRPQIVTRASRNKLALAEFDKWAEPLAENITRVLGENLSLLLATDRILVYPWGLRPVQYKVEMRVIRFDGNADGEVLLGAHWSIFGSEGRQALLAKKSSFTEPAGDGDYEAMAAAMSRMLADLSREIAAAIKGLTPKKLDRKDQKGKTTS